MLTLLDILQKTTAFFTDKGVPSPRHDAECLVGHALGLKRMQLYLQFERPLKEPELETIRALVRRRARREPLQHILGAVEFSGLTLKTDPRALIPRPETEYLVELVIERLSPPTPPPPPATPSDIPAADAVAPSDAPPSAPPASASPLRILDLGTGTGAIALALARRYPDASIIATDTSDDALALARENAAALSLAGQVTFLRSDWFAALPPPSPVTAFDLIVSNPPYLTDDEVAAAEPEVRDHDPRAALVAPEAGLADLRVIIDQARPRLAPGGLLALETGIAHHDALLALADERGYTAIESVRDLAGRPRFFFARAPNP
ncbi:protein-(glutamine-N5) methyltransferase, release factor-specific [Opitutaceae bacterium TAV1]|nr:protein-(glutamine-N5) methyltransferase, release factor-specific [Opitutaceae bacterium TAV1]